MTSTDIKDSFVTLRYKAGYIHLNYNRTRHLEEIRVQFPDGRTHAVRSMRAAQLQLNAAQPRNRRR